MPIFTACQATHSAVLTNLPQVTPEVAVGPVPAGQVLHFSLKTLYGGTYYAFSTVRDARGREAFTDRNGSLGWGGPIVESTGVNRWVLHIDYAASSDDDDNDLLVQLRIGDAISGGAPRVLGMTHAPGASLGTGVNAIALTFDQAIEPATLWTHNFALLGSGGDGGFGDGDEVFFENTGIELLFQDFMENFFYLEYQQLFFPVEVMAGFFIQSLGLFIGMRQTHAGKKRLFYAECETIGFPIVV